MSALVRPLAASAAAVGLVAWLGYVSTQPQAGAEPGAKAAPPTAESVAQAPVNEPDKLPAHTVPVAATVKYAVTPKPLSNEIKKGLLYLIETQQDDGGWSQGGGWRTSLDGKGGRVDGPKVEDPSDVGNTCISLLALIRAGNTATSGEHAANVRKGLAFILGKIEKADSDSLHVTDVRNTQLQSKIGPYVDTFLANLVLAEMKGKGGELETRLVAALDKTVAKIVKHQGKDGQFAGNGGWAPVLSQGIANKALSRSKLAGVKLSDEVLVRAAEQSQVALAKPTVPAAGVPLGGVADGAAASLESVAPPGAGRGGGAISGPVATGGSAPPGDAGVGLYRVSQGAGNSQDVENALKVDAEKAKKITEDARASKEEKEAAKKTVDRFDKVRVANAAAQAELGRQIKSDQFVAGFGSNGGEEFLSFLNIAEALVVKGGKDWQEWDTKMQTAITRVQDKNGSWSGHHCITGKNFCTAAALLVLMADRTPVPADTPEKTEKGEPASGKK